MTEHSRTLIVVATYNEIENLPRLVDEIFSHSPNADILVIDDNSPDGTGRWCNERAADDSRFFCIHREGKLGLGSATIAGFRFAIEHDYEFVLTMDADFSHPPRYLPDLRELIQSDNSLDVVIGSRYVKGGAVDGWPLHRRVMSRLVNWYARALLGLQTKDNSGAFRCYRVAKIAQIDFDEMQSRGYSYLEEILWRLKRAGAKFGETPITFVDRELGATKINLREALAALWIIFRLGIANWLGLR